jgi:hypothetical protein
MRCGVALCRGSSSPTELTGRRSPSFLSLSLSRLEELSIYPARQFNRQPETGRASLTIEVSVFLTQNSVLFSAGDCSRCDALNKKLVMPHPVLYPYLFISRRRVPLETSSLMWAIKPDGLRIWPSYFLIGGLYSLYFFDRGLISAS